MEYALLALCQVAGLVLIPFGLPGTWLQVLGMAGYAWATDFTRLGWPALAAAVVLAIAGEVVEFTLGARYTRMYGGSPRAAWGAILGGLVGAFVGVPVFLVGSVIGAFIGAFAGAVLLEMTRGPQWRDALRAGWGAFLGRLIATVAKAGVGVVIAALALVFARG
ncbi:MAG TPA: DUF456 domain-containing protein [Longimicrobium sp.]|jgi:hypothetical protein|uniref:DUF456 domain-containing protein n=1 Tax=Longimicrobium sp. TaxID=2029185 RepID=UPI002ED9CDE0